MGILPCARHRCENIMCDRYSNKYGYLCNECFEELRMRIKDMSIGEFMDSPKGDPTYEDTTDVILEKEFELL